VVEERGQLLRRRSSLSSSAYEGASTNNLDLDKFHKHIDHVFDLWKSLGEHNRHEIWQREILRSYVRMDNELKEARNTIKSLRRDVEHFTMRLDRMNSTFSPYQTSFSQRTGSISVPLSPMGISEDALSDLHKQGVSVREWEYERILDRWKNVVRDERRASNGLSAQRNFSTSSQHARVVNAATNLSVSGGPASTTSRSPSITSAMSVVEPTRTSSMDSAAMDADAEGEEEDMDGDNIAPDAQPYTRSSQVPPPVQSGGSQSSRTLQPPSQLLPPPPPPLPPPSLAETPAPAPVVQPVQPHLNQDYRWPQAHASQSTPTSYNPLPNPATVKRLPPGPASWHTEFHHAAAHNMEGIEGSTTVGATTSAG
jgi:hypothetical protein